MLTKGAYVKRQMSAMGVGRDPLLGRDQEETEGRKPRLEAAGLWDGRRVQLRDSQGLKQHASSGR